MPRGTDRYDEARLQQRLWTPYAERSILGIWYDAGDLGSMAFATGISQWNDKSGNARHATQATGSAQPTYSASDQAMGGRPSVRFIGAAANCVMSIPSIAATGWTAVEAYYVFKNDNDPGVGSNVGPMLGKFGTAATSDHEPFSDSNVYHGFAATVRLSTGNPTLILNQRRIIRIRSAASDWSYWVDGTQHFSTGTNTVGLGATPQLGFGVAAGILGNAQEIIIVNTSVSTFLQQRFEGYLAWKWGLVENLPASHLYKQRPPLL